jgi:hypothetical protein
MKTNVNFNDFIDAFRNMDRENQFSYEGKKALFEYEEQLEEDLATEQELDVIGLCCEYAEYDNLNELQQEYTQDYPTLEALEEATTVIKIEGTEGFIIRQF